MHKHIRKLTALMLALLMSLTGLSVLAESPLMSWTPQEVYARGNAIKSEVSIQVNAQAAQGLVGMFSGPADENTKLLLDNVLGALSKLTFSMLSNQKNASFLIGSRDGDLLMGQMDMGAEGNNIGIALDLLPGLKIEYPPEMSKTLQQSMQMGQNIQEMQALVVPYVEIVNQQVQEVLKAGTAEAGPFDVTGVDVYDSRVTIELTPVMVQNLVVALGDHFVKDEKLQAFMKDYVQSMPAEAPVEGVDALGNPEELAQKWEETKKDMAESIAREDAPKSFGTAVLYQGQDKNYLEFELKDAKSGSKPMFLSAQQSGNEQNGSLKLAFMVRTAPPSQSEPNPEVAWDELRQSILSGENLTDVLFLMDSKGEMDADKGSIKSDSEIEVHVQGMRLGLTMNNQTNLKDKYASEGKFAVSVMTPDPILTVQYRNEEVSEAPEQMPEGLKSIQLQDQEPMVTEADTELLGTTLMEKGLPQLIQKLKTALPEEGQMLAAMLAAVLNQGQVQPQ